MASKVGLRVPVVGGGHGGLAAAIAMTYVLVSNLSRSGNMTCGRLHAMLGCDVHLDNRIKLRFKGRRFAREKSLTGTAKAEGGDTFVLMHFLKASLRFLPTLYFWVKTLDPLWVRRWRCFGDVILQKVSSLQSTVLCSFGGGMVAVVTMFCRYQV